MSAGAAFRARTPANFASNWTSHSALATHSADGKTPVLALAAERVSSFIEIERSRQLALDAKNIGQITVRLGIVRLKIDGLFVFGHGLVQLVVAF